MFLKPFSVLLLTSLLKGEMHAYKLLMQMDADAPTGARMNSRAVYREIPRLIAKGLIESVPDTRPVRYRITKHGRSILLWEREFANTIQSLLKARL